MNTLTPFAHRAAVYAAASHGDGTLRAYRSAWRAWSAWCATHDLNPLAGDSDALAAYLAARADTGLSVASLRVALAGITHACKLAGVEIAHNERLRMTLKGVARKLGTAPQRQAKAATPAVLRALLPHMSPRDRCIALIGFGAALRRSEIVALDLVDVRRDPRGLVIDIGRSKTDATGAGALVAIARGPVGFDVVAALDEWLVERGHDDGPLFTAHGHRLTDRQVARMIAAAAKAAGLAGNFSGHSLRAGMITAANASGGALVDIARHARHSRLDSTAGYIRDETVWDHNVSLAVFAAD